LRMRIGAARPVLDILGIAGRTPVAPTYSHPMP
jgi:hypothetical protein